MIVPAQARRRHRTQHETPGRFRAVHSPSPCERPNGGPRGLRWHDRTDRGGCASTQGRSGLWTTLGTGWGQRGVLLWTSARQLWTSAVGGPPRRGDLRRRPAPAVQATTCRRRRATVGAVRDNSAADRRPNGASAGRGGAQHPASPYGLRPSGGRPHRRVGAGPDQPGRGGQAGSRCMVARVLASERKQRPSDEELDGAGRGCSRSAISAAERAGERALGRQHGARWGSCTPVDAHDPAVRRLVGMPGYVIDYVLLHELAHLHRARGTARRSGRGWRATSGSSGPRVSSKVPPWPRGRDDVSARLRTVVAVYAGPTPGLPDGLADAMLSDVVDLVTTTPHVTPAGSRRRGDVTPPGRPAGPAPGWSRRPGSRWWAHCWPWLPTRASWPWPW